MKVRLTLRELRKISKMPELSNKTRRYLVNLYSEVVDDMADVEYGNVVEEKLSVEIVNDWED